jgi:prepilin-type processing-associated H-X9-DG protein
VSARRTLVPLLVLALAGALWLWRGPGPGAAELPGDVARCNENLRWLYGELVRHRSELGHAPRAAGPDFLAALFASGVSADTPANRARLACPGRGGPTPYAARDALAFPPELPAGGAALTALAACASSRNHDGHLNVLYSDGSVVTLSLEQEIELGRIPAGTSAFSAGPDSPLPELAPLTTERKAR